MTNKSWFVYLLECHDGSLYTGVTTDVEARMRMHATGKGSKYVARKGFRRLLHARLCASKSEACSLEYQIKQLPRNGKLLWFREQASLPSSCESAYEVQ